MQQMNTQAQAFESHSSINHGSRQWKHNNNRLYEPKLVLKAATLILKSQYWSLKRVDMRMREEEREVNLIKYVYQKSSFPAPSKAKLHRHSKATQPCYSHLEAQKHRNQLAMISKARSRWIVSWNLQSHRLVEAHRSWVRFTRTLQLKKLPLEYRRQTVTLARAGVLTTTSV